MCEKQELTPEDLEHQENLEFILKYGRDITEHDPDDDPEDEFLLPPDDKEQTP